MATDGYVSRWNGIQYPGGDERRLDSVLMAPGSGGGSFSGMAGRKVNGAGLQVSVGASITVTAGGGVIFDPNFAAGGPYVFEIPSTITLTAPTRPATGQLRIDLIVTRLYDSDAGLGSVKEVKVERVQGVANASPSAPALPDGSLELARLLVPNSGTIGVTHSSSRAVAAGGVIPVATTTDRDALAAYPGMTVYVEASDALFVRSASTWRRYSPDSDSGWVPLSIASGYESYNPTTHGTAAVRLKDGIVYFRGGITRTSGAFPASAVTTIARVPDGFRPASQWEGQAAGSTSVSDPKVSILRAADADAGALRAHVGSSVPAFIILSDVDYPID